jgi:hypothetical protein
VDIETSRSLWCFTYGHTNVVSCANADAVTCGHTDTVTCGRTDVVTCGHTYALTCGPLAFRVLAGVGTSSEGADILKQGSISPP